MNWIDIALGLFMILFIITGIRRGFLREVMGLVGLIVAFVLGVAGSPIWSVLIVQELHFPSSVATAVSFILIFILIFLLFKAVGSLLHKLVRSSPLRWFDRLGGSIFGLLKSGMIISVFLLILGVFTLPSALSSTLNSSRLVPPLRAMAPTVFNLIKVAFPRLKSLGEVAGQSVERGFTRGKEQVLEKGAQVVDMLQKEKQAGQREKANRQDSAGSEGSSDRE